MICRDVEFDEEEACDWKQFLITTSSQQLWVTENHKQPNSWRTNQREDRKGLPNTLHTPKIKIDCWLQYPEVISLFTN
jgi:hypothetical protein